MKCPFKFELDRCRKECPDYYDCLKTYNNQEAPKLQIAKKPEPLKCPYGKEIDCQHIKAGGMCARRTYGNRKPDTPCTSYLRKPKVKL